MLLDSEYFRSYDLSRLAPWWSNKCDQDVVPPVSGASTKLMLGGWWRDPSNGTNMSWFRWHWIQLCYSVSRRLWQTKGSGFGSTTYAVKVDLPGCFAKPCWLQEIRVGVDESNSVASLAKMGVYRSDGTLAKASETLQMPTSLQDHAWLSFTFLGYDNETWLKMKSHTGFESIILVQQKYVRLCCWFYSNFTEIAFPVSLWFMICLLWFVMNWCYYYVLVVD